MEIEITKMTSKGQVVIPQEIREHANLKEGEKFLVYDLDGTIILKKVNSLGSVKNIDEFERVFSSMWKTAKTKGIGKKDVGAEIQRHRKEKHA